MTFDPAKRRVGDDWVQYLKESGNYESYDGQCNCYACRKIRDNYFTWKEKQSFSPNINDIVLVESEGGTLHEMTVKSTNQKDRTVSGEITVWKTDLLHIQDDRKIVTVVTVPQHSIRKYTNLGLQPRPSTQLNQP